MTTDRDNRFTLLNDGITAATFVMTDYDISPGQPWRGVTVWPSDKGIVFDVDAGRHKTAGVATWFHTAYEGGHQIATDAFIDRPLELNFAFRGNLYFTSYNRIQVIVYDLVIAQGHNDNGRNNWHIGGHSFQKVAHPEQTKVEDEVEEEDPKAGVRFKAGYGNSQLRAADKVKMGIGRSS